MGKQLKDQAVKAVAEAADHAASTTVAEAQNVVADTIERYRKRLGLVLKTYPVAAAVIFLLGYGVGSGAKWVGVLL